MLSQLKSRREPIEDATPELAFKKFRIVLIKPSKYDDDGYVIRWYRSPMPANSLASVYGLIDDCAQRRILGPETDIEIVAIDETNARVRIDRIISDMRANNNFGFVGLVGAVQSVPALAAHREAFTRGGHSSDHRRLSCLRHVGDVQ